MPGIEQRMVEYSDPLHTCLLHDSLRPAVLEGRESVYFPETESFVRIFQAGGALLRVQWMPGSIDPYLGSKHDVISDGNPCGIEDHAAMVGIKIIPNRNIVSVITLKGGFGPGVFARLAK